MVEPGGLHSSRASSEHAACNIEQFEGAFSLRRTYQGVAVEASQVQAARLNLALNVGDASDSDLVGAAQNGSAEAAEALARRHWQRAYRAAYLISGSREDAEDATQEALIAALASIGRFRRGRSFESWLSKIAIRKAIDAARARDRRERLHRQAWSNQIDMERVSDAVVADEDLVRAISDLSLEQRVVVVMRFALGYETNEVAKILGIPRGTVGSRLRRGLDEIRATYERHP